MKILQLSLPFTCRSKGGRIDVTLQPNEDTIHAWGLDLVFPTIPPSQFPLHFHGFPVINANITYPKPPDQNSGYGSLFGWIQLVKETKNDGAGEWEIDVYPWAKELKTPFTYWGLCPTLFDAPARLLDEEGKKQDGLRWRAQSFLCVLVDAGISKTVLPIPGAAFSWGFDIEVEGCDVQRKILIKEVEAVDVEEEWGSRARVLRASYPDWEFLDNPMGV